MNKREKLLDWHIFRPRVQASYISGGDPGRESEAPAEPYLSQGLFYEGFGPAARQELALPSAIPARRFVHNLSPLPEQRQRQPGQPLLILRNGFAAARTGELVLV